jgi:hypothetical protein
MKWVEHATRIGMRNAYKILVEKTEWKRQLGRIGRQLEENIKLYLKEVGCEDMGCIQLVQNGSN